MTSRRGLLVTLAGSTVGLLLAACSAPTSQPAPSSSGASAPPKPAAAPTAAATTPSSPVALVPPTVIPSPVTLTRLKIAGSGSHAMGSAPLFIAERIGAFKAQSLEVEVIASGGGAVVVTAVGSGSVALGVGGLAEAIQAIDQGAPIRIVATFQNRFGSQITANKAFAESKGLKADSPLAERVAALKGARIGITAPGSSSDQLIRFVLKEQGGMDPDRDVNIRALRDAATMLVALQQRTVDAVVLSPPVGPQAVAGGYGMLLINPLGGDVPALADFAYIGMFASEPALRHQEQADVIVRALRAISHAQTYIVGDKSRGRAIMKEEFSELGIEDFEASFEALFPSLAKELVPSRVSIEGSIRFLNQFRDQPLKVDYEQIVNADIGRRALQS